MRADYQAILQNIAVGARVLDVGCSDGSLLEILRDEKNCEVRGLELSQDGVNSCVEKGLAVIQGNADYDLGFFPDDEFDVVILSDTIQATLHPQNVLNEIRRIGKSVIISIPNFAYYKVRAYLLFFGKMPVTKDLPDTWYNTRNLHLCSVLDFADLAKATGFEISSIIPINNGKCGNDLKNANFWVNLLSQKAIFTLNRT